jgi:hypothetical protein
MASNRTKTPAKKPPQTGARSDQAASRLLGRFTKGRSGNPTGRPPGIEDKRVALRSLLDPHAPKLIQKVVAKALKGDMAALRICMDRLVAPLRAKDTPVRLETFHGTLADRGRSVLDTLGRGDISPDEAGAIMQAVSAHARIVEVADLAARIAALEARGDEKKL